MKYNVRDKKTNRKNKMTKLIEKILDESLDKEYVWYYTDLDELVIMTPNNVMQKMTIDAIVFGRSPIFLPLGEL